MSEGTEISTALEASIEMQEKMFDTTQNAAKSLAKAVLIKNRHDEAIQVLRDLVALTGEEDRSAQDAVWDRARAVISASEPTT